MRANGIPHLIGPEGHISELSRIDLSQSEVSEEQLQELMHGNPALLPVDKFDGSFGPLISLGREILGIDNLFISPTGRLTVVEAKLWRNPQATRTVLAQVLDYASRLSRLSYEELESACQAANRSVLSSETSLFRFVTDQCPDHVLHEQDFVDRLQRDLRNGRFLLLVVGDGIREGLEHVLDALHQQSRLHFTFGLVTLGLYRESLSGGTLVVPNVIAHSTEVERAVVTIRGTTAEQVDVDVRSGPAERAPKLTEQEFLESIEDPRVRHFGERLFQWARQNARIYIVGGGKSAVVRLPFSTTRKGLILMRMYRTGRVLVTPPRLRAALRNSELGDDTVLRIARALKDLFPELEVDSTKDQVCGAMRAEDLLPRIDEVLKIYADAIERLKALDPGFEEPANEDT